MLTQTTHTDYQQLCRLDILGLEDSAENYQQVVYDDFEEELKRSPEVWYVTALSWKRKHRPFPNNHAGSLKRIDNVVRK